jgi:multiple sugar transport system substrate-binding protein
MVGIRSGALDRRRLLQGAALGVGSALLPAMPRLGNAQAGRVAFTAWSAAVDQVQAHITAFQEATGIEVAYENFPWAQYRAAVVTRLVGGADMDVLWVSDAWLPEFAEAGWLSPIDDLPELMKYNDEMAPYCLESMIYDGQQYGLPYYGDHMSFMYNARMLEEAGIAAPPTTWDEVVEQSKIIKEKGLADYPLLLSLAADTWLVEFITALVYAHGGRLVADDGSPVMADPDGGAMAAARFVRDAIHTHGIVSPGAVETQEINGLRAMGEGLHAFGIIPTYRIRALNDPSQAPQAGHIRLALMPNGAGATAHNTCGWLRFYGLTPTARNDAGRLEAATQFIEFFGGRDDTGEYTMQKLLLLDLGLPFCCTPLHEDAAVQAFWDEWAGTSEIVDRQAALALKKDVISPWFSEWNEVNNRVWQSVFLDQASPEDALGEAADEWAALAEAYR